MHTFKIQLAGIENKRPAGMQKKTLNTEVNANKMPNKIANGITTMSENNL